MMIAYSEGFKGGLSGSWEGVRGSWMILKGCWKDLRNSWEGLRGSWKGLRGGWVYNTSRYPLCFLVGLWGSWKCLQASSAYSAYFQGWQKDKTIDMISENVWASNGRTNPLIEILKFFDGSMVFQNRFYKILHFLHLWQKHCLQNNGQTDLPIDTPSHRDTRTYLYKTRPSRPTMGHWSIKQIKHFQHI